MKKPLNVYLLRFSLAAIPLALVLAHVTDAGDVKVLSRPVPAERIYWMPELLSNQSPATLHVVRESHWKAWGVAITLLIDGKPVASIKEGENVMLRVPPGQYELGLRYAGHDLSTPTATAARRSTAYYASLQRLDGGKSHDFRIVADADWNWQLDRQVAQ